MHRRTFLAAAGAPLNFAQSKEPIPIGFLGVAHAHGEAKRKLVQASADWRLVGVVESNAKLREGLASAGVPLLSREQLLNDKAVRVIAVESAVRDHARDALDGLRAGKHVHLEKAPAATLRDFQAVVEAARSRKLLLQVGYMWRYHPGVQKILEAASQGWLGDVYSVRGVISSLVPPQQRAELAEFSGGAMFEFAGHVIDPLVRLLGKPARVTPFLRRDGKFDDALRDNTAAMLEWPKAMGVVQSSTLQPGAFRYRAIEIHGANGSAVLNPIEPGDLSIWLAQNAGPYKQGPQKVPLPDYQRYVDDFAELASAVRGQAALRVSYDEDLAVQETLLRASGMT